MLDWSKTFFKSLIMRIAAKFKTIKNRHLRVCCIFMNECQTTVSARPKKIPISTLFKPMHTDLRLFHFQMCCLVLGLNFTFKYNSLEELWGYNAQLLNQSHCIIVIVHKQCHL